MQTKDDTGRKEEGKIGPSRGLGSQSHLISVAILNIFVSLIDRGEEQCLLFAGRAVLFHSVLELLDGKVTGEVPSATTTPNCGGEPVDDINELYEAFLT